VYAAIIGHLGVTQCVRNRLQRLMLRLTATAKAHPSSTTTENNLVPYGELADAGCPVLLLDDHSLVQ
jgi:hypothetical protein